MYSFDRVAPEAVADPQCPGDCLRTLYLQFVDAHSLADGHFVERRPGTARRAVALYGLALAGESRCKALARHIARHIGVAVVHAPVLCGREEESVG